MKRVLLGLMLVALAMPVYAADVLIKVRTHTDAMSVMGQNAPASDVDNEIWVSPTKMATLSPDTAFIIDLDANVALIVNHRTKSYVESPLPLDFAKLLPPEAAPMAAMMQVSATVKPTGEAKTIRQWACKGYDVTISMMGMPLTMKVWASTQVPFDVKTFQAKMMPAVLQGQMRMNPASVAEFAKIEGYQISSETAGEMMGAKLRTTSDVMEMIEKAAPAGTYQAPAGYTKKTSLGMEDLQRR